MSPRDQERRFPVTYAAELMRIAFGDLASAGHLVDALGSGDGRAENAAYLYQQAIEKALKAVLCARGLPVPLVHDLGVLVAKIPSELEPDFGYELTGLDEYATVRRYEEGRYGLSEDELAEIGRLARQILGWADRIAGGSDDPNSLTHSSRS